MNLLAESLKLVRLEGLQTNFFKKLSHCDFLIIDDFGMKKLDRELQNDFEQIIDDRYASKTLILSSQLPMADWYYLFQSEMIAEACLDRLVLKAIRFELKGDSLRKNINFASVSLYYRKTCPYIERNPQFCEKSNSWEHFNFEGEKWKRILQQERKEYQLNAYRVLLTRARQEMAIVVSEGNVNDPT